jgi:hypothetical protein
MMKNIITSGAFSKGRKPGGDPFGKRAVALPKEAKDMTIFN